MAFVSIEDTTGHCDLVVFSDSYKMFGRYLEVGEVLNVFATKQVGARGTSYIVNSIKRAGDIKIFTTTDHIQIELSKDNEVAQKELIKILNEANNPLHEYSPFIKNVLCFWWKRTF